MNNFTYHIPTKIIFGKGVVTKLKDELKNYKNILLVYGGGSIKKIGLYDKIYELLEGHNIFELSGVEPNPRVTSVNNGAKICKENNIDVILAVGGGSVIDCAKVIAAASKVDCDAWDLVTGKEQVNGALPLYTVLTLSATGSEMDNCAVISNLDSNDKLGIEHDDLLPVCSIEDPTYTETVSKYQTAAGSIDIFSHLAEVYFDNNLGAFVTDKLIEGLMKTVIKYGPIAYNDPNSYEARSNLMWASSLAINGLINCGKQGCAWSCHPMEHSLSAYYDITHGMGLAILTPIWMEYILNEQTLDRFVSYGENVFNLSGDKMTIAKNAINETKKFFASMNAPKSLSEVGIDETNFNEMAKKACKGREKINGFVPLNIQDVINIYKKCL